MTAKEFNKSVRDLFDLINGAFNMAADYLKTENYNIYYTNISINEEAGEAADEVRYTIDIDFSFYFNDRDIKKAHIAIDDRNLHPAFIAGLLIGTVYTEDFYQDVEE